MELKINMKQRENSYFGQSIEQVHTKCATKSASGESRQRVSYEIATYLQKWRDLSATRLMFNNVEQR